MNGKTREQHYGDYSKNWNLMLETIYTELYMPSGSPLLDVLKSRCKIAENIPQDEELLRECWNEYGVESNVWECHPLQSVDCPMLRLFIPFSKLDDLFYKCQCDSFDS
ncbi:unnamed protein product [Schistosoma rodhaini]|nr:unnamed protein product [Schistosoma rodhaini]CAH8535548.1 unnamed protein product [Schistosoma rodhaini]